MSVPVALVQLRAAVEERGSTAYVVTVSDDGTPHAVHAPVDWDGETLVDGTASAVSTVAAAVGLDSPSAPTRRDADEGGAAPASRTESHRRAVHVRLRPAPASGAR